MTKEEFLQSRCATCTLKDNCPNETNCGFNKSLALGWDACERSLKEKATTLYKEGKIDSYALGLLFKEEQHPVDEGRKQAKEKH